MHRGLTAPSLSPPLREAAEAAVAQPGLPLHRREARRLRMILERCPEAAKLAMDVPVLLAALAAGDRLGRTARRPLRSIGALLTGPDGMRRWRGIARWLGWPSSRGFVGVLRRLRPGFTYPAWAVVDLPAMWTDARARKALLHARGLTPGQLQVLYAAWGHGALDAVAPALLAAAGAPDGLALAERYSYMLREWRAMHAGGRPPRWAGAEDLDAAREAMRRREQRAEAERAAWRARAFPEPPLPGDGVVEPLVGEPALAEEGAAMGHCIGDANWAVEARCHGGYGYRVACADGRATLWIRRAPSLPLGFELAMVRGPRNADPEPPVWEAIARWWARLVEAPPPLPEPWTRPVTNPRVLRALAPPRHPEDDIPF